MLGRGIGGYLMHAHKYTELLAQSVAIFRLVSVSDPKPTPARIAFNIPHVILKAIYVPDEVWGQDYL